MEHIILKLWNMMVSRMEEKYKTEACADHPFLKYDFDKITERLRNGLVNDILWYHELREEVFKFISDVINDTILNKYPLTIFTFVDFLRQIGIIQSVKYDNLCDIFVELSPNEVEKVFVDFLWNLETEEEDEE